MLLDERNDTSALHSLKTLGAEPLPPTPTSGNSLQSTASPEDVMSMFGHHSWHEDVARRNSLATDKMVARGHFAAPGTSDDLFVTLPVGNSKKKDERVILKLKESLPPPDLLQKVLDSQAEWWNKITTCMIGPGGTPKELTCINSFTKWALSQGTPLDVAKVLQFHMSYQCSDAELEKHLELIESLIIQDDQYMGTLSGVEVAFLQARHYGEIGQIRRAWLTTRRALSFAQLMGLHRTRINVRQDFAFWGLFQFDRFCSLMLGSPPLINDIHCNLTFKGKDLPLVMSNNGFLTRLAVVAGKVMDRVQGCKDMTFSSLLAVDQEITRLGSQMPPEFWHLESVSPKTFSGMAQWMDKSLGQVMYHETRMVLHLPYLLRSVTSPGFEYSREACIESARSVLRLFQVMRSEENKEAYKVNSVDFIAIIAATTIVMGLIGGIRPITQQFDTARQQQLDQHDWELLDLTLQTYKRVENRPFGKIASQSRKVLEKLTQFRDPHHKPEETGKIVIPFFGTITVQRGAFRGTADMDSPGSYSEPQVTSSRHQSMLAEDTNEGTTIHPSMTPASAIPSQETGYNSGFSSQIAYNGVYLQHSPYENKDNYIKNGVSGMSDYIPSGHLPQTHGWQNVGTFDLDQDWNWDMGEMGMSPHVNF
jgi:hypothetical protein